MQSGLDKDKAIKIISHLIAESDSLTAYIILCHMACHIIDGYVDGYGHQVRKLPTSIPDPLDTVIEDLCRLDPREGFIN